MVTLTLARVAEIAEINGWEICAKDEAKIDIARDGVKFTIWVFGEISVLTSATIIPNAVDCLSKLEKKGYFLTRCANETLTVQGTVHLGTDLRITLSDLVSIKTALECYARDIELATARAVHDFETNTHPIISR